MLKNYLTVSFRNLLRHKSFSFINVFGLAISLSVCLLIILVVDNQLSYDEFHANQDDIYRITHRRENFSPDIPIATVPLPIGQRLKDEQSGVASVVRFRQGLQGEVLDGGKAISVSGFFTEPEFFNMFSFNLESGDSRTCLDAPNSIILRKDVAEKFFDTDPIGQTLDLGKVGSYEVTGVFEEFPGKTHMRFEALASLSSVAVLEQNDALEEAMTQWENTSDGWVYFMMEDGIDQGSIRPFLDRMETENYNADSEYQVRFHIQKMTDITTGELMGNQIGPAMPSFFIYGLVVLAVLIMTTAGFNYTNLSVARSLTRAKEIGIRKVSGAFRYQLFAQFITESVVIALLALVLSILMLQILIPAFETLTISSLLEWELKPDAEVYLYFTGFTLIAGLLAGIFPALYLSSFQPTHVLKNLTNVRGMSKVGLRKALVVIQFVLSLILIISSTLVYQQIRFMINKDYGFEKESIVNIDLQGQSYNLFKDQVDQLSIVSNVSAANNIPSVGTHYDVPVKRKVTDESADYYYFSVDENYISNLDLSLIAGRNFSNSSEGQSERYVIANEAAVKELGFLEPSEALGQTLYLEDSIDVQIIGVVANYNYMMLFMEIQPLLLRQYPEEYDWMQVKLSGDLISGVEQLESAWDAFDPNHDFEYQFFDAQIEEFYSFFYDIVFIVGLIAILAISIASMGLLGMATYSAQTRLKEIGIRKVLGATIMGLTILLSKGFVRLLLIAMLIGVPLAYFGNQLWLSEFAYRVDFGIGILAFGMIILLVLGLLTVGSQTWRAATANPVDHLRNE